EAEALLLRSRRHPCAAHQREAGDEEAGGVLGATGVACGVDGSWWPRRAEGVGPCRSSARQEPGRRLAPADGLVPRRSSRRLPVGSGRAADPCELPREALQALPFSVEARDDPEARALGCPR